MVKRKLNVIILRSSHVLTGPEYVILDLATQLQNDKDIHCTIVCLWRDPRFPLPLFEEAKKKGLDVKRIDAWGRYNFLIIPKLLSFVRKNQIDLIHTHGYKADIVGLSVGRLAHVPVVCHVHGFVERYPRTKVYNSFTLLLAPFFDRVVACSDSLARTISQSSVKKKKLVAIRNCISIERCKVDMEEKERAKRDLGLEKGDRMIANLARIDPEKGHIYILRAAREVLAKFNKVKFVIVGDGRLMGKLEYFAQKMGIAENVIFTGYRKDAQAILSFATVVVFPSLKEGFPLAMLEGMAHGKPVVASAVDGIPEVIENGVNGFLISPANHKDLAGALGKLLSDAELSSKMGERARKTIEDNYTIAVMSERIKEIYNQLCSKRDRSKK